MDLPDFYLTGDDYSHRFESEEKERFLDLIQACQLGKMTHTLT